MPARAWVSILRKDLFNTDGAKSYHMKLLIIGAGGYGQLVREIAELTEEYEQIDFLDDAYDEAVGKVCDLKTVQGKYDGCVVAIGNPEIREKIFLEIDKPKTIIHPKAVISKSASIGSGCVIEANSVVSTEAVVKDCSYICAGAVINHNAMVSEFCQVNCNSVVMTGSVLPKGTKLNCCSVWSKPVVAKPDDTADSFF